MTFDRNKLKDIKFRHHNTLLYAKELFNAIDEFYKTENVQIIKRVYLLAKREEKKAESFE